MSQKSRNSNRMHAALYAAFGVALILVGSVGVARAEDDADNSGGNWVRNLYRTFNSRGGQPISNGEYQRPPLVVPPTRELPPPGTPGTLAQRSSSWPVDRDEARRKAGATAKAERRPAHWEVDNQPVSAVETPGVTQPAQPVASETSYATKFWNKFLGRRDPEAGVFTGEPPRLSLVDPPRGYRTPSAAEPYGITNLDTTYTLQHVPGKTGKPEEEGRDR